MEAARAGSGPRPVFERDREPWLKILPSQSSSVFSPRTLPLPHPGRARPSTRPFLPGHLSFCLAPGIWGGEHSAGSCASESSRPLLRTAIPSCGERKSKELRCSPPPMLRLASTPRRLSSPSGRARGGTRWAIDAPSSALSAARASCRSACSSGSTPMSSCLITPWTFPTGFWSTRTPCARCLISGATRLPDASTWHKFDGVFITISTHSRPPSRRRFTFRPTSS